MGADFQKGVLRLPAVSYLPPLALFLVSHGMVWYVLIWNEPFWQSYDATLVTGQAASAAWLFTIKEMTGGEGDRGLVKYGFGVWGWCEWGDSHEELAGRASCYGGGAWSVPASAGRGSGVDRLDLPSAITTSLFPCAVFVIIALLVTAFCSVVTLFSWKYKHNPPKKTWSYADMYDEWGKYDKPGWRYPCACVIMAWRTAAICIPLVLLGTLPAIIASAIGKAEYQGVKREMYNAEIGQGGWLLVGVIVMTVVAFVWIAAVPGLWPHKGKRLTKKAQR